ncbi:MAG: hypothetical protein IK023_00600 [Bacteroidaceae bacterium]|nr:hypothetical protein [Bacteroidaceae bacterium]
MKRYIIAICIAALAVTPRVIADDDNSAWMSRVDDNAYVSQLSIPGAHDAATGHGTDLDAFARTQDLTLTELWNLGVRAFDFRPAVDGTELRIYHGTVKTNLTLSNALTTLCNLLDSHPSELAIVVIRHETEADDNNSGWNNMMTTLLSSAPVNKHTVAFKPLLQMAQARGKLLVLSRNAYRSSPIGGFIYNWSSDADFEKQKKSEIKGPASTASCYIQDFYDMSASGAPATKSSSVQTLFNYTSTQNTDPALWAINHTSGYSITLFSAATRDGYRENAATQNSALLSLLSQHAGATGIVMMDCAGVDHSGSYDTKGLALTTALVRNNFIDGPNTPYFRALTTVEAGVKRSITTEINNVKYYLTTEGYISDDPADAGAFTFKKVKGDAFLYAFQFREAYFTNPPVGGNPTLNPGHICCNRELKRSNWEAQVFMQNGDGLYAVRATNAPGGTTDWAINANTYWTVFTTGTQPEAGYATAPNYIWQIEEVPAESAIHDVQTTDANSGVNGQWPMSKDQLFDLSGRKISQSQLSNLKPKGIYIWKGQKVML